MRAYIFLASLGALGWAFPQVSPIARRTPHIAEVLEQRAPAPTGAVVLGRRGLGDDIKSLARGAESRLSSFAESGILDFANGFPTGTAVEKSLGISSNDLAARPTQVLNLPSYGNWTDGGWNLRIHGNVYKLPNVSQDKIDDLADVFLIGTAVKDLSDSEKAQARNVTRSIFVIQQADKNLTMDLVNDVEIRPNVTAGAVDAKGGRQAIRMPFSTTIEGDFDEFVQLQNTTGPDGGFMKPGNETSRIQTLNMYAQGTNSGNATAYLVPSTGITIISDIDDILRVTKIYEPMEGILNTFVRPLTPWMNMPQIYANWSASLQNMHFHYLTTTPEQVTRTYMDFIYKTYPPGSFDTRPLNFSDTKATLHIRRFLLDKVFRTFPQRTFVLVADTSNPDVMAAYPAMYKDYPGQVTCILLRNTSSTDPGDKFPYDTSGFKGIPQDRYMFFHVPDDLARLDISNGHCLNGTIVQNVTFGEQGLPLGLGEKGSSAVQVGATSTWAMLITLGAVLLAAGCW
ncbi:hypothetical protein E4U42_004349 [Claviceps africana]|uniref:Phosphatidate phosphatase APP1 catalytic domain-containing protein n=1 Tax=Claviceps africana TaxID=83212 RepID=A0A8K0JC64_9HYPO|nr:hypothetical protein E4U42_004349 [Claviceps africana]